MTQIGPYQLNSIVTGDSRELARAIPDESVDLIFTDPVYENVEDYEWLGVEAMRLLKPNSSLLVWCSKRLAARCQIAIENSGLDYVYTLDYVVNAKQFRLNYYHLFLWTTPCLWFQKGRSLPNPWIPDTYISYSTPTGAFKWNKNYGVIEKWLCAFSQPDSLIFDPFTGEGSVPAICRQTGRNFLAFEINGDRAETARHRVALTPMPLPFEPSMTPQPLPLEAR